MAMPAAQSCVVGAVPPADIGKASGTFNALRQLGGTFGIAILAAVFTEAGSYASGRAFGAGFVPVAFVAAGLSLAGALCGVEMGLARAGVPIAHDGVRAALDYLGSAA